MESEMKIERSELNDSDSSAVKRNAYAMMKSETPAENGQNTVEKHECNEGEEEEEEHKIEEEHEEEEVDGDLGVEHVGDTVNVKKERQRNLDDIFMDTVFETLITNEQPLTTKTETDSEGEIDSSLIPCAICAKTFKSKYFLKRHMKVHSMFNTGHIEDGEGGQ